MQKPETRLISPLISPSSSTFWINLRPAMSWPSSYRHTIPASRPTREAAFLASLPTALSKIQPLRRWPWSPTRSRTAGIRRETTLGSMSARLSQTRRLRVTAMSTTAERHAWVAYDASTHNSSAFVTYGTDPVANGSSSISIVDLRDVQPEMGEGPDLLHHKSPFLT